MHNNKIMYYTHPKVIPWGWTNKRTDKQTGGQTDEWKNGQIFTQYSGISSHSLRGVWITSLQHSNDEDDTVFASNVLYSKSFRSRALDHFLNSNNFVGAMFDVSLLKMYRTNVLLARLTKVRR